LRKVISNKKEYKMKKYGFKMEDVEKPQLCDEDQKPISIPQGTDNRNNNHIYLYAEIDRDSSLRVIQDLRNTADDMLAMQLIMGLEQPLPIYLHIFSYGGSVNAGFAIVDAIRNSKVPVYSVIEGQAASAATLVSISCHKRFINKHARFLIHELSGFMGGKLSEMQDSIDNAKSLMSSSINIYQEFTKIPKPMLDKLLRHDLDLTPQQCLKWGFVDKIL
jgi:ATP-dependent Clp protease, protease subunit